MDRKVAIYGASGHGKVVADIARAVGYEALFVDDGDNEYPTFDEFVKTYGSSIPVALGVGENRTREKIYRQLLENGFEVVTLIHPGASVSESASIEEGVVVMPGAVVNVDACIGIGAIVNSGAVIEHDCQLEHFVHISPNVALGGNVRVGYLTHIGIGSSVIQGIHIGKHCIIGAGAAVIEDIEDYSVAVGVPTKVIKRRDG